MENLGINLQSMLIYSGLFLLMYIIIKTKFLPSLDKVIKARKDEILKLESANKFTEKLKLETVEKLKESEVQVLRDAKEKADQILKSAEKESEEIIKTAKSKASLILEESKELIEKYKRSIN